MVNYSEQREETITKEGLFLCRRNITECVAPVALIRLSQEESDFTSTAISNVPFPANLFCDIDLKTTKL